MRLTDKHGQAPNFTNLQHENRAFATTEPLNEAQPPSSTALSLCDSVSNIQYSAIRFNLNCVR